MKNSLIQLIDTIFAYFSSEYVKRREEIQKKILDLSKQNEHPVVQQAEKIDKIFHDQQQPSQAFKGSKVGNNHFDDVAIRDVSKQDARDEKIVEMKSDEIQEDDQNQMDIQITPAAAAFSMIKYPTLTLAAHGVNQYQAGGPAACTPLSCHFISSKDPLSSESIEKLILENNYHEDGFAETETCIMQSKLKVAENPWAFQRDFGPTMQVSFELSGQTGLKAAVKSLVDEEKIGGAIFIANGVTIAMRKQSKTVEFLDSHGDDTLTGKGNAAYVNTFTNDQIDLIAAFLQHRFPDIEFTPNIEIWPIQC